MAQGERKRVLVRLVSERPLLASLALVVAIVVVAAGLVLPSIEGIEVARATVIAEDASGRDVEVLLRWQVGAAGGVIVVRAPAPGGSEPDARERLEVGPGRGEQRLVWHLPKRDVAIVVAELRTTGGLWDQLLAGRRQDVRVVGRAR